LLENVKRLRQWESLGAHLIHPWRVVLAGPPNVGKSSLFNALLGFDRAITSPHPGTTRDLVEATLVWKGFPIILIDTAGMREATDSLEAAGIARATEASADADMVLWLIDLSQDQSVLPDQVRPTFVIGTKGDLPRLAQIAVNYTVSSATNTGLNDLLDGILAYFLPILPEPGQGIPVSDQDRKRLLELEEQLRIAPASACEPPPAR
jgi:tRNA modification GTPase